MCGVVGVASLRGVLTVGAGAGARHTTEANEYKAVLAGASPRAGESPEGAASMTSGQLQLTPMRYAGGGSPQAGAFSPAAWEQKLHEHGELLRQVAASQQAMQQQLSALSRTQEQVLAALSRVARQQGELRPGELRPRTDAASSEDEIPSGP
jgi:hypothetical protein